MIIEHSARDAGFRRYGNLSTAWFIHTLDSRPRDHVLLRVDQQPRPAGC